MDIYIDNKKMFLEKKKYKTLGLVMDEINKMLEREGKLLYDIFVNGSNLIDHQVIAGDDISLVEVVTRSPKLVIVKALQDMELFIERYFESLEAAAGEIEMGEEVQAIGSLYEIVTGLEWCTNVLYSMKENTAVDFKIEGFDEYLEEFASCISMAQDAMDSRDIIVLFEMLEFEVSDLLSDLALELEMYIEVVLEEETREGKYA